MYKIDKLLSSKSFVAANTRKGIKTEKQDIGVIIFPFIQNDVSKVCNDYINPPNHF